MGRLALGIAALGLVVSAVGAAAAAAEPGSGPHETIDQTFSTTRPGTPTGVDYTARFHAAGDEQSPPPYMRRMTFYPPPGFRNDTSVPAQCTAPDAVLQVAGPAACPPGSQIGSGTTEGIVQEPFRHDFDFDHFTHPVYIFNNANEQVVLIESEGYTVVRGAFRPDGSLDWHPPTCFPVPPTGCVDDYILQLGTQTTMPVYTTGSGPSRRSYQTTPPTCPSDGYWRTTGVFEWSDGSTDTVVTRQPCTGRKR
jgi:hypothetical protein